MLAIFPDHLAQLPYHLDRQAVCLVPGSQGHAIKGSGRRKQLQLGGAGGQTMHSWKKPNLSLQKNLIKRFMYQDIYTFNKRALEKDGQNVKVLNSELSLI